MLRRKLLITTLALLFSTLACRAATRLIFPDTPSPQSPTPAATLASLPTEIAAPLPTAKPAPAPITCTDDTCFDACLTRINEALETGQAENIGGEYADKEVSLDLVLYKVEDGKLGAPAILYVPKEFQHLQQDVAVQQSIWNYASSLLPPDQLKWISEFFIFTDGPDNTLAWVDNRDILDRAHWQLGIDIMDAADPIDLTYTLVHEFAHLITLNTDQIPPVDSYSTWAQNPATCPQFSIPEGCTSPDSYLNLFYQRFWSDVFDEWFETVEEVPVTSNEEYGKLVTDFYYRYEDLFVNDYAATNIREDMAESFMYFVLEEKPKGDRIFEQKIRFFYEFPELVSLRKQIIQNVCSYAQP
ncbi:MAG: hypothetical protein ACOYYF_08750 [Chloroflexota bacterium]|nr:hypothetical protein [Chloroflexota bacterium]MBI5704123.1 hypothetical protein [Chloroflexota bacterium]